MSPDPARARIRDRISGKGWFRRAPSERIDFLPDADEIEQQPTPILARGAIYLLALFIGAIIAWASLSEVDEIVLAHGRLITPEGSSIVIQPIETSIIRSIQVRIGEVVKKGQRLIRLDPTFVQADSSQLQERVRSLDAQIARLEAELAGRETYTVSGDAGDSALQERLFREKHANYTNRLAAMNEALVATRAEMQTNARDQVVLANRLKTLSEIEDMQAQMLGDGHGARLGVLVARERRQEVERDLVRARNHQAELDSRLAQGRADMDAFVSEWTQRAYEELVGARRERSQAFELLQKAQRRQELVELRAPQDGVVLDIAKRSVGSVVREAEPLMTLVPVKAKLEAEIQIDTRDIGYVSSGNRVRVKIDAFPYQKHGTLDGELRLISEDVFPSDQSDQVSTAFHYLGRVSVGEMSLKSVASDMRLLPGMTLSAEVVVGKRTVISYFTYPFTRAFDEAIREP
jgi:HlyD family secretion protein